MMSSLMKPKKTEITGKFDGFCGPPRQNSPHLQNILIDLIKC